MTVNIHIHKLVLGGLTIACHQQKLLQTVVEMELERLFSCNNMSDSLIQGGAVSHLSAGDIQLNNNMDLTHLGRQIARAVHKGLDR